MGGANHGKAWTAAEDELIRKRYRDGVRELAALLPARSVDAIRKRANRLGAESPDFAFSEGNEYANKPAAIGAISRRRKYLVEKTSDGWQMRGRLVWERANGPVPEGQAIRFRNGDPSDVRLENLCIETATAEDVRARSGTVRYLSMPSYESGAPQARRCRHRSCPFPPDESGECGQHRVFFAFPVSMTDTALDMKDIFADVEGQASQLRIATRAELQRDLT